MKHSPSWSLASQEIHRILWNPKVYYRIHNSLPPIPILSHIYPVHAPSHFSKIQFNAQITSLLHTLAYMFRPFWVIIRALQNTKDYK